MTAGLVNPTLLVTLHRDINDLAGMDGKGLGKSKKQQALRWGVFTMTYATTEAFFNGLLNKGTPNGRLLPLNPDKIRMRASLHDVEPFADNWGVRTRTLGTRGTNHSQWTCYVGTNPLRNYLTDMKILRDILSHGGDPFTTSNASGALWRLANGRSSMRLMGIEGFIQACCDLAAQTVLAFGGDSGQVPEWPEPERSALSAEPRPPLPLLP